MANTCLRIGLGRGLCVAALLISGTVAAEKSEGLRTEAELIAVLESDADWVAKQDACRGLRVVGTAQSVPALAKLLTEPELSHLARFALEPMPYPEAGAALRDALARAEGSLRAGLAISLGERRDEQAVAFIAPLLGDADPDTARAAAGALGRIASGDAVKALQEAAQGAPKSLRPALGEGLLAACEQLAREGKAGRAAKVLDDLAATEWPEHVRLGALRVSADAQPKQAPERLLGVLAGDDATFRGLAAQIVAETRGSEMTAQYAEELPALPDAGQAALLRALGDRGDSAARAAVLAAVQSEAPEVRLAAIGALSALGEPGDVPLLADLLAMDDAAVQEAAKSTIRAMECAGLDDALAEAVGGAVPPVQARLIELLSDRMSGKAVPAAMAHLDEADAAVRTAALRTLVQQGDKEQAPALVAKLKATEDDNERALAAKALTNICGRHGDALLPLVLEAMGDANVPARQALLRTLGRIGNAGALEAVVAALNAGEAAVADEAASVLSAWPNSGAAPHLLALAKSGKDSWQDLGFSGYVRLAREEAAPEQKADMLDAAMQIAERPAKQWRVLAAWGTLPTQRALKTVLPLLQREGVQDEAAAAVIAIAAVYGKQGEEPKLEAAAALKSVLEQSANENLRKQAEQTLASLGVS